MFTALQDGNLGRILDKFSISSSVGYSLLKPYERFSVYISGFLYRVTDIFQKKSATYLLLNIPLLYFPPQTDG